MSFFTKPIWQQAFATIFFAAVLSLSACASTAAQASDGEATLLLMDVQLSEK